MKKLDLVLLALTLLSCNKNVEKAAPKPEAAGPDFVLLRSAIIQEHVVLVVLDKPTGNILYITPRSGVYVPPKE